MRTTHTFAIMKVTKATFDEIAQKMRNAGYDHVFDNNGTTIDMHGIGIEAEETVEQKMSDFPQVIIHLEGGLVQDIISDVPVAFLVADTDIEGICNDGDPNEITNDHAACSLRTPTPMQQIDPKMRETVSLFLKEVFHAQ